LLCNHGLFPLSYKPAFREGLGYGSRRLFKPAKRGWGEEWLVLWSAMSSSITCIPLSWLKALITLCAFSLEQKPPVSTVNTSATGSCTRSAIAVVVTGVVRLISSSVCFIVPLFRLSLVQNVSHEPCRINLRVHASP
jgi:hypothetical protein